MYGGSMIMGTGETIIPQIDIYGTGKNTSSGSLDFAFGYCYMMGGTTGVVTYIYDNVLADGGTEKKSYGIIVERVDIPHTKTKLTSTSGVVCSPDQVTADLIRKIGTDLERHRTVADITARRNVSRELTEQIVRLYVTHPGVTAEQIMSKMGL